MADETINLYCPYTHDYHGNQVYISCVLNASTSMHACARTHARTHTWCTHAHTDTHMHTHTRTHAHTHTCTHTHTRTHTHTHPHTHSSCPHIKAVISRSMLRWGTLNILWHWAWNMQHAWKFTLPSSSLPLILLTTPHFSLTWYLSSPPSFVPKTRPASPLNFFPPLVTSLPIGSQLDWRRCMLNKQLVRKQCLPFL